MVVYTPQRDRSALLEAINHWMLQNIYHHHTGYQINSLVSNITL
jgi:hypothetical protein